MQDSRIVSVIGAEGTGKSTLCNELTRRIGAQTVIVPEWPAFDDFLKAPAQNAFNNQTEAMRACLSGYKQACTLHNATTVLLELCPVRVHLIYSTLMNELGYFTSEQWATLLGQYESVRNQWPRTYIYLDANDEVIRARLQIRKRKEDLAWNLQQTNSLAKRWRALISSEWRKDKKLLEIPSARGIEIMSETAIRWLESLRAVDNPVQERL